LECRLACGSDTPSNRAQLRRWFKILADMGRIDPDHSTPLCVRINRDIVMRQAGKGGRKHLCSEPSHRYIREQSFDLDIYDWDRQCAWLESANDDEPDPADIEHITALTANDPDPWGID
jgi:hypothetical protein